MRGRRGAPDNSILITRFRIARPPIEGYAKSGLQPKDMLKWGLQSIPFKDMPTAVKDMLDVRSHY